MKQPTKAVLRTERNLYKQALLDLREILKDVETLNWDVLVNDAMNVLHDVFEGENDDA